VIEGAGAFNIAYGRWLITIVNVTHTHHAEGRVDPDDLAKKNPQLILDTPEHVESENINLKIGNGSSLYQLFSKRDFYFINCG
jgi:hypothetical protein